MMTYKITRTRCMLSCEQAGITCGNYDDLYHPFEAADTSPRHEHSNQLKDEPLKVLIVDVDGFSLVRFRGALIKALVLHGYDVQAASASLDCSATGPCSLFLFFSFFSY